MWSILRNASPLVALAAVAVVAKGQVPTIRLTNTMSLTLTHHEERGDYDDVVQVGGVSPASYSLVFGANIPNPKDTTHPDRLTITRTIRMTDDSAAHRLNIILSSGDPDVFPGSTMFLSRAMFNELKSTGTTSAIVGDVPPGAFQGLMGAFLASRQYYRGTLALVGQTTVPVIVDDTVIALPAIESRGRLSVGGATDDVDVVTFDNPAWPITLKWSSQGRSAQVTQIVLAREGVDRAAVFRAHMAAMLGSKTCRAEVHGIYFAFNSAQLAPESDPALQAIAQTLADNPSWAVTIEGHTDSIGTHTANLDLSKRRAAAVRDALVDRFKVAPARLSTAGFGDGRPVAPNATLEGRARNRRVELARKC